jgi:hypothetical protein
MKIIQVGNNRKELIKLLQDHKDDILIASFKDNEHFVVLPNRILDKVAKDLKILVSEIDFNDTYDEFKKLINNSKPMLIGRADFIN